MPNEARISPTWSKQKLLLGIFFIAFGAWFMRDAIVGYPRSNERWEAHNKLAQANRESDWPAEAQRHGWTVTPPEKRYERSDIVMQYVMGGLLGAIGGLVLLYWATQKGRILRTDDEAVYTAAGTRVPFPAITDIDKRKWETKGIARVRYTIDGRLGRFVIDDYKFDTDPTRRILDEIEEKTGRKAAAPAQTAADGTAA